MAPRGRVFTLLILPLFLGPLTAVIPSEAPESTPPSDTSTPFSPNASVLIVVAHPDDETLFGWPALQGPGPAANNSTTGSKHVLVLFRSTPPRMRGLANASLHLNFTYTCICVGEEWIRHEIAESSANGLASFISQADAQHGPFDAIVTHNCFGEYGHPSHLLVGAAVFHYVTKLAADRFANRLWVFVPRYKPPALSRSYLKVVDLYAGAEEEHPIKAANYAGRGAGVFVDPFKYMHPSLERVYTAPGSNNPHSPSSNAFDAAAARDFCLRYGLDASRCLAFRATQGPDYIAWDARKHIAAALPWSCAVYLPVEAWVDDEISGARPFPQVYHSVVALGDQPERLLRLLDRDGLPDPASKHMCMNETHKDLCRKQLADFRSSGLRGHITSALEGCWLKHAYRMTVDEAETKSEKALRGMTSTTPSWVLDSHRRTLLFLTRNVFPNSLLLKVQLLKVLLERSDRGGALTLLAAVGSPPKHDMFVPDYGDHHVQARRICDVFFQWLVADTFPFRRDAGHLLPNEVIDWIHGVCDESAKRRRRRQRQRQRQSSNLPDDDVGDVLSLFKSGLVAHAMGLQGSATTQLLAARTATNFGSASVAALRQATMGELFPIKFGTARYLRDPIGWFATLAEFECLDQQCVSSRVFLDGLNALQDEGDVQVAQRTAKRSRGGAQLEGSALPVLLGALANYRFNVTTQSARKIAQGVLHTLAYSATKCDQQESRAEASPAEERGWVVAREGTHSLEPGPLLQALPAPFNTLGSSDFADVLSGGMNIGSVHALLAGLAWATDMHWSSWSFSSSSRRTMPSLPLVQPPREPPRSFDDSPVVPPGTDEANGPLMAKSRPANQILGLRGGHVHLNLTSRLLAEEWLVSHLSMTFDCLVGERWSGTFGSDRSTLMQTNTGVQAVSGLVRCDIPPQRRPTVVTVGVVPSPTTAANHRHSPVIVQASVLVLEGGSGALRQSVKINLGAGSDIVQDPSWLNLDGLFFDDEVASNSGDWGTERLASRAAAESGNPNAVVRWEWKDGLGFLPSASVRAITASHSLMYAGWTADEWLRFIREAARVIEPHGVIRFTDDDHRVYSAVVEAERAAGMNVTAVDPKMLEQALLASGFAVDPPLGDGHPFCSQGGDHRIMRRAHMEVWLFNRGSYFLEGIRRPAAHSQQTVDSNPPPPIADAIVIGAGPIGLKLSAELRLQGLQHVVVVEQGPSVASTIRNWYHGAVMHSLPYLLSVGGIPATQHGRCSMGSAGWRKCGGLQYWQYLADDVTPAIGIDLRVNESVAHIRRYVPDDDRSPPFLTATTERGTVIRARNIVVATGRLAIPRRLDAVPGENLPHVFNRIGAPGSHSGRRVMVVGGGVTALEQAAILCKGEHAAKSVLVSYRGDMFPDPGFLLEGVFSRLKTCFLQGILQPLYRSQPQYINSTHVSLAPTTTSITAATTSESHDAESATNSTILPADDVILALGFRPNLTLWEDATNGHVDIDELTRESTVVPGLFAVVGLSPKHSMEFADASSRTSFLTYIHDEERQCHKVASTLAKRQRLRAFGGPPLIDGYEEYRYQHLYSSLPAALQADIRELERSRVLAGNLARPRVLVVHERHHPSVHLWFESGVANVLRSLGDDGDFHVSFAAIHRNPAAASAALSGGMDLMVGIGGFHGSVFEWMKGAAGQHLPTLCRTVFILDETPSFYDDEDDFPPSPDPQIALAHFDAVLLRESLPWYGQYDVARRSNEGNRLQVPMNRPLPIPWGINGVFFREQPQPLGARALFGRAFAEQMRRLSGNNTAAPHNTNRTPIIILVYGCFGGDLTTCDCASTGANARRIAGLSSEHAIVAFVDMIEYLDEAAPGGTSRASSILRGIDECQARGFPVVHAVDTLSRARLHVAASVVVVLARRDAPSASLVLNGERLAEARACGCLVHLLPMPIDASGDEAGGGSNGSDTTPTMLPPRDVVVLQNLEPRDVATRHGSAALRAALQEVFVRLLLYRRGTTR